MSWTDNLAGIITLDLGTTETDLSGLVGLSGISVAGDINSRRTIIIDAQQIILNGILSYDPDFWGMKFTNSPNQEFLLSSTCSFNAVLPSYRRTRHIEFTSRGRSNTQEGEGSMVVEDGATVLLTGGTIEGESIIALNSPNVTFNSVTIDGLNTSAQLRMAYATQGTGFFLHGYRYVPTSSTFIGTVFGFNPTDYKFIELTGGVTTNDLIFENYLSAQQTQDIALSQDNRTRFLNPGADVLSAGFTGGVNNKNGGVSHTMSDIQFVCEDTNQGALEDYIVYSTDTLNDSGNRIDLGVTFPTFGIDLVPDNNYTWTHDAGGISTVVRMFPVFHYLLSTDGSQFVTDYRDNGNTAERNFTFYFYSYGQNSASAVQSTIGLDTKVFKQILTTDTGLFLTQLEAEALTEIDNMEELYAYSKLWQMDNPTLPALDADLFIPSGSVLNTNYDFTLDAGAVDIFSFVGTTLTVKAGTLNAGVNYDRFKSTNNNTFTSETVPNNLIFDGWATLDINTPPASINISNSLNGLKLDSDGAYDVSLYTFTDNTSDISIVGDNLSITIITGGKPITVTDTGLNNTVTIDDSVFWTFNVNPQGGTFAMLNIDKFGNFLGVYLDHATAQASNSTPVASDYYAIDNPVGGDREDHGYFNGSQWVIHGSGVIHEFAVISSSIGGAGMNSGTSLGLIPNTNYRWAYDARDHYPKVGEFNAGTASGVRDIELTVNSSFSSISEGVYIDILTNYLPLANLSPADSNGTLTAYMPTLPEGDVDYAIVFVELMRLSIESVDGMLTTNNASLVEIIDKVIFVNDDTLRVYPLESYPSQTKVAFGALITLVNYTIEFTPYDANGNYLCFNTTAYNQLSSTNITNQTWSTEEDINALGITLVAEHDITQLAVSNLNDPTVAEIRAGFNEAEFKDKNTELEIHTYLNTYTNKDDWKADVSNLSADVNVVEVAGVAVAGVNDFKADVSAIETKAQADARQALLIQEHNQTQTDISNISGGDVNIISVNGIAVTSISDFHADLTPTLQAIANLNDVSAQEVRDAFNASEFKDKNTESEIHAWLNSYLNKDDWKADVSNLSADVNVVEVGGIAVTSVEDFKADLTPLETKTEAGIRQDNLLTQHTATQSSVDDLKTPAYIDSIAQSILETEV